MSNLAQDKVIRDLTILVRTLCLINSNTIATTEIRKLEDDFYNMTGERLTPNSFGRLLEEPNATKDSEMVAKALKIISDEAKGFRFVPADAIETLVYFMGKQTQK